MPTSVTVVLLDLLNTSWTDQLYARKALIKFLDRSSQDRIAIFAWGAAADPAARLHDRRRVAHRAPEEESGEIASELAASTLNPDRQRELQILGLEALADANQREADFFTAGRVVNTLSTLEAIAQHLSGHPGRKNLIWLSGGFPHDRLRRDSGDGIDARAADVHPGNGRRRRALNDSGVAVYPVDARGLMVLPGFDASVRGSFGSADAHGLEDGAHPGNIDAMRELAIVPAAAPPTTPTIWPAPSGAPSTMGA